MRTEPDVSDDGVESVQRIAVATDRTEGGDRAVRWAQQLAARSGSTLAVIQVVEPGLAPDVHADTLRSLVPEGTEVVVLASDDVAASIVEAAQRWGADLLVVGNSGMRGRAGFLLGNVANRVTHLATCSVLVVNSNDVDRSDAEEPTPSSAARLREIAAVLGAAWAARGRSGAARGEAERAELLRTTLEQLGPTFCKLGQMLSTRPDLLPAAYIAELEKLQADVPPMSETEVVRVMEQEFGVPWEDVVASIDPEPLAAGTIGQVHRARLVDGSAVVIKVQREGIAAVIDADLTLLERAGRTAARLPAVGRVIDLPSAIDALASSLRAELDFRLEADNLARMAEVLEPFDLVRVPRCHPELSGARVLVMDEVPGTPLHDAPPGESLDAPARQLLRSFFAQILEHGFFHADPHPGNLLYHDGRIWMIDLGMVGELDDTQRSRLVLLLLAVARQEIDLVVELTTDPATHPGRGEQLLAYRDGLGEVLGDLHGRSMAELDLAAFLDQLTRLSVTHGVPLPTDLMMVGKAIGQVQLTVTEHAPDVDPVEEAGRFVLSSMTRRLGRRLDPQQLVFEVERIQFRIRQLSDLVGSVTGTTPGRQLEIGFRSAPVERAIRQAGRTVGLGLTAGLAWIAAASAEPGRRRALTGVAGGLTAAFGAELARRGGTT